MDTKNERRTESDMQSPAPAGARDAISPPSPTSVELPSIPGVLETSSVGEVAVVRILAGGIDDQQYAVVRKVLAALADAFCNIVFDFSKVEMFSTSLLGAIVSTRKVLYTRWQPGRRGIRLRQMLGRNFEDVESAIRTIVEESREASVALCGIKPKVWDAIEILTM